RQRGSRRPVPGRRAIIPRHPARLPRRTGPSQLQRPANSVGVGRPRPLGATGGFPLDSQQPPDNDGLTPPPPGNGGPPPDEPIDDAQLSARAWVARNGPTLLLIVAALVGIYYKWGLESLWTIAKVALGLGAVIFIHELGHFLVAKWCDVHVQTFSIG